MTQLDFESSAAEAVSHKYSLEALAIRPYIPDPLFRALPSFDVTPNHLAPHYFLCAKIYQRLLLSRYFLILS